MKMTFHQAGRHEIAARIDAPAIAIQSWRQRSNASIANCDIRRRAVGKTGIAQNKIESHVVLLDSEACSLRQAHRFGPCRHFAGRMWYAHKHCDIVASVVAAPAAARAFASPSRENDYENTFFIDRRGAL